MPVDGTTWAPRSIDRNPYSPGTDTPYRWRRSIHPCTVRIICYKPLVQPPTPASPVTKTPTRRIPAQRYDFPAEDVDVLLSTYRDLLSSRSFLTLGDHVEDFERAFAEMVGARHAVAVSSGTAALELILRSLDVKDREVVVPTNTFAATPFAVLHAGGRVVFADCDENLAVDCSDVERRITSDTRALIAVHIGGFVSSEIPILQDICRERDITLIEDAAHAHGSALSGRRAGTLGEAAAFSFFSTKVMTTGEGGMVVTDRDDVADDARLLRDQAKVAGENLHEQLGHNWRMTEFQALMGLAQLARLPEFISERQRVARIYDEALLGGNSGMRPVVPADDSVANYYKYIVFTERNADEIGLRLRDEFGVRLGGTVYDVPCHRQPVFQNGRNESLPRAERLCPMHICPPIYPSLTDDDARYVAHALLEVVE